MAGVAVVDSQGRALRRRWKLTTAPEDLDRFLGHMRRQWTAQERYGAQAAAWCGHEVAKKHMDPLTETVEEGMSPMVWMATLGDLCELANRPQWIEAVMSALRKRYIRETVHGTFNDEPLASAGVRFSRIISNNMGLRATLHGEAQEIMRTMREVIVPLWLDTL